MGITPQVFHHVPKPISWIEFLDALRATCPPRFPLAKVAARRNIGVAVSGGVDSMALAFLLNQAQIISPNMKIADNPIAKISGLVVDHKIRKESSEESLAVFRRLAQFKHFSPHRLSLHWGGEDPAELSNIESVARRLRYRRIANSCVAQGIESLFFAHHSDDQYETVLMRLLAGHGSRGLRGMLPANNIPESYDIHGAYESGHIDDQAKTMPFLSFHPKRKAWRYVRRQLGSELNPEVHAAELAAGLRVELDIAYIEREYETQTGKMRRLPLLPPVETEDAGIMVYRPLLEFSKDRLIATCEANKIKWFEDHTNQDQTLTPRNAVRQMCKNHQLPVALQKPAILRLSRNCVAKARVQDSEAERWATRTVIQNFEPNAGTIIIELPDLSISRPARRSNHARKRHEARIIHRRTIAALLIRRLISFVTPETHLPQIANLQTTVSRLFPAIAHPSDLPLLSATPKAFNHGSVLFIPLQSPSRPLKWFLSREPNPSNQPLPSVSGPTHSAEEVKSPRDGPWYPWRYWRPFDGRFWIRWRGKTQAEVRIAPFAQAHAQGFREGLDEKGKAYLADVLRRYAPGKVRYTLPALYASRPKEGEAEKLVALPTMAVQLPGLEKWLQYEVRYRKVDMDLLESSLPARDYKADESQAPRPRRRRRARTRRRRELV